MSPALSAALEALASHGVIGIVACIALYGLASKDRELSLERQKRLDDKTACNAELAAARVAFAVEFAAARAKYDSELAAAREEYDDAIAKERDARLEDGKAAAKEIVATNERLHLSVHELKSLYDFFGKPTPRRGG